jgi:hypothetical protein
LITDILRIVDFCKFYVMKRGQGKGKKTAHKPVFDSFPTVLNSAIARIINESLAYPTAGTGFLRHRRAIAADRLVLFESRGHKAPSGR